jgi:hypothetical protein
LSDCIYIIVCNIQRRNLQISENRLLMDFYLCVDDRVCKVPRVLFNICVCERKLFFFCRVLSFIFYWFGMVRRKLTIPERWQAVGMHNGGCKHKC